MTIFFAVPASIYYVNNSDGADLPAFVARLGRAVKPGDPARSDAIGIAVAVVTFALLLVLLGRWAFRRPSSD